MDGAQLVLALCAGLGLSAAAGFRVFVPLLLIALSEKLNLGLPVPVGEGFEWITSWPAIIMLSAATLVEVAGYYLPWVDNLLDSIATPAALVSGTLVTAAILPEMPEAVQWVTSIIVGGGSAGMVQGATVLARAASTATTGGVANPAVSTGEAVGAVATGLLAMAIPFILAGVLLLLFIWIARLLWKRLARKKDYRRLDPPERGGGGPTRPPEGTGR